MEQKRARIEAYEFKGSTYWRLEDKNHRSIENIYEGTRLRDFIAHTRTIGFELINYKENDKFLFGGKGDKNDRRNRI